MYLFFEINKRNKQVSQGYKYLFCILMSTTIKNRYKSTLVDASLRYPLRFVVIQLKLRKNTICNNEIALPQKGKIGRNNYLPG